MTTTMRQEEPTRTRTPEPVEAPPPLPGSLEETGLRTELVSGLLLRTPARAGSVSGPGSTASCWTGSSWTCSDPP